MLTTSSPPAGSTPCGSPSRRRAVASSPTSMCAGGSRRSSRARSITIWWRWRWRRTGTGGDSSGCGAAGRSLPCRPMRQNRKRSTPMPPISPRGLLRSAAAVWLALAILHAAPARAQIGREPVRIVFPFAAGGSGDALARLIAEHLRIALDQPVIVENRAGAQGRIGVQAVKAAAPDGKTLLLTPVAPMSVYAHVYKSLAYDPIGDFQPVSQVATFDFGLAVGPEVPANSLKELVDWVKANPSQGSYGTPAAGTLPHFFAVSF